jgi:hypothetical protein
MDSAGRGQAGGAPAVASAQYSWVLSSSDQGETDMGFRGLA